MLAKMYIGSESVKLYSGSCSVALEGSEPVLGIDDCGRNDETKMSDSTRQYLDMEDTTISRCLSKTLSENLVEVRKTVLQKLNEEHYCKDSYFEELDKWLGELQFR
ncbi:hypothetical protein ACJMK2_020292, partial [Sinanodonta woodiana]